MNLNVLWFGIGNFGLPLAKRCIDSGAKVISADFRSGKKKGERTEIPSLSSLEKSQIPEFHVAVLSLPSANDSCNAIAEAINLRVPSIVDFSTISPSEARRFREIAKNQGVQYANVPLSGSLELARKGELVAYVSDDACSSADIQALVEAVSVRQFRFPSDRGASQAKLINQFMHLSNMLVIGQALGLAKELGLDAPLLLEALRCSSGNSAMLERFGVDIANGDYPCHFSLRLAVKDIKYCAQLCGHSKLELSMLDELIKYYERTFSRGDGMLNFSAVCKNWI